MTINLTAYDTIGVTGIMTRKIQDSIEKAYINSALSNKEHQSINSEFDFNYVLVEGGNTFSDHIPFFGHPILFNNQTKDNNGQPIKELALDVRNFGKHSSIDDSFIVRNKPEYNWAISRLVLNNIWVKGRYEILRDISNIPLATYSTLISECIARQFALNKLEQINISILASYFYYGLFTEDERFDEMEYVKIVAAINRATKVPNENIVTILDELDRVVIKDLKDLCDVITRVTNIESLKMLNCGLLISLVSGLWYGNNSREIMAVGLEHPPTWVMIVFASISDNTYTRSILSKTSTRFTKGGSGDNFEKSIMLLLNSSK